MSGYKEESRLETQIWEMMPIGDTSIHETSRSHRGERRGERRGQRALPATPPEGGRTGRKRATGDALRAAARPEPLCSGCGWSSDIAPAQRGLLPEHA